MDKIYNRSNVGLSGAGIRAAQPQPNLLGAAFDSISKTTERLAQENYALGKAELINSVTQTAYETAPDDPKKFNELINSGFEKGLQGLDDNTKDAVLRAANEKVKLLQIRVGDNLNTRLDRENSEKVINLADQTLNGVGGVIDTNRAILSSIMMEDKERTDALIRQRDEAYKRLNNYAGAKNMKGALILGKNAAANMAKTGEQGMFDAVRDEIFNLSYDELKNFDESIFQDRKRFMKRTGLSQKSYDNLEKQIKSRRKALNDADKRQIITKNIYDSFHMTSNYDPDTMKKIKKSGALGDNYDKFEKVINEAQNIKINDKKVNFKGNKALEDSADEQMIEEFGQIIPVLASKPDGSADYNGRLIGAFIQAQDGINKIREQGIVSKEHAQILDRVLTEAATNQVFADSLDYSFGEGTMLRELAENAGHPKKGKLFEPSTQLMKGLLPDNFVDYLENVNPLTKPGYDYLADEKTRKMAFNYAAKQLMLMAETIRSGDFSRVQKLGEETNKELIKIKYSSIINPLEMSRLERERAEGKRAFFTVGVTTYEFLGFGGKDIFVEEQL